MKQPIFQIIIFSFLIWLALFVGNIVKPFTYVDNATSQIVCDKNGQSFEAGWNFIYTFTDRLDTFNDEKARKLCEFNIIKDYSHFYKNPLKTNYRFEPKLIQESSWPDAILIFFAVIVLGTTVIGRFSKRVFILKYVILSAAIGLMLFFLVFKKPSAVIFCQRQIARKVNNFKRVIFKYNIFPIPEEDQHIESILPNIYQNCLKKEGF